MKETPSYIKALVMPRAKGERRRRVWSIDLETVWLPFFTATNTMGDTAIPLDALGCPLRLAYDKDGSVRFSADGRPMIRVAKAISQGVANVKENVVANLREYFEAVATENQKAYAETLRLAEKAGKPIIEHDKQELDKAIQQRLAEAMEEATEAETPAPAEAQEALVPA